jgi:hypothetical protein
MTRRKKIAIIGKGTAGAVSASMFVQHKEGLVKSQIDDVMSCDLDWYYGSSIKTQPVGEGSTIPFTQMIKDKYGNML